MTQPRCKAVTKAGKPCESWAVGESGYCLMHDPDRAEERREVQQAGGASRSAARRAARQWTIIGDEVSPADLPKMLRAAMLSVMDGTLEPSQATALATLAKASVSLSHDIELEARIEALEAAVRGVPLRRVQ